MLKYKLENFEGPLELLLSLIDESKLDISDISLAKITDQYLDYVKNNQALSMEEIADFLIISARLLYIKSKLILPEAFLSGLEDDDEQDLARQLKIYKEYHDAKKVIQKMINKNNFTYSRIVPLLQIKKEFIPPRNISSNDLKFVMEKLILSIKPILQLPKKLIDKTINIKEKIDHIQELLSKRENIKFSEFIKDRGNKTEIIVSFLAMLELIKQRTLSANQDYLFEEIIISAQGACPPMEEISLWLK